MEQGARDAVGGRELVERLGGHPVAALGIDLDAEGGPERWFLAACVLAGRAPEARGLAAARALGEAGLLAPARLAAVGPEAARALLDAAGHPAAEPLAHRLVRASAGLVERHQGSFDALASGCEDLESLGGALASLAPGVGASTVLRFLRPLRGRWGAAAETPLDPTAALAAVHLGWLDEGDDGAAGTLAARLADDPAPPALADLEAALTRLGARACRRGDVARCPLGEACPAR